MNTRTYIFGAISALFVFGAIGYAIYAQQPAAPVTPIVVAPTPTPSVPPPAPVVPPQPHADMIQVVSPTMGMTIASPLEISGEARGMWYFEASFPIELKDAAGITVAQSIGTAQGEWMTENFVPFTSTLSWTSTTTGSGTLILHRDNPSGLPEHDKSVEIPVVFK